MADDQALNEPRASLVCKPAHERGQAGLARANVGVRQQAGAQLGQQRVERTLADLGQGVC